MKIKIISDGTPKGTRVLDDKGDVITNVDYISWELDFVSGTTSVNLSLTEVPVVLVGDTSAK